MESFALTCTTCKSRLKVRDPGAVGQIMACPKCGGMVLVKPPEGPVLIGGASSSDGGETRSDLSSSLRPDPVPAGNAPLKSDAFDAIDELLGNVPARTMVPTPTVKPTTTPTSPRMEAPKGSPPTMMPASDPRKSPDSQAKTVSQEEIPGIKHPPASVVGSAAVTLTAPPQTAAARPAPSASSAAVAPAATATAAHKPIEVPQPSPAPTASDSETVAESLLSASPWQYWVIVSASGLLGVALAIGVVLVTISWLADPPAPVGQPITLNPSGDVPVPTMPVAPVDNIPAPEPPAGNPTSAPGGPENRLANVPPKPAVENPPVTVPADQPAPVEPMPRPVLPMAPEAPPNQPMRDPLGLTDPTPPPAPAKSVDDPLKKFDNFLGGDIDPLPAPPMPEVKPILPPPEEEPANSPTSPLLPKPQPRHIDVAARLAEALPAIEVKDSPLADFLQVMQDLSTVPITLRPDGLAMVKLLPFSSETPVAWQGKGSTVLETIQGALAPLGLEARIEADQLVVDVASPQLATMRMGVKDLTEGDDARASQLAELLQSLVAPETWNEGESGPGIVVGKDELQVKQHRAALAECILIVEKIRKARGLTPQSRFDPKLFELATRGQKAAAPLATPITLNYSQPTPLLRVVDRLGKTAGVRILIDWQALSSAGWNPEGEVTLSVEKQPLSKTLDDLTQRMELTWRVVDGKTLQITTPMVLAERTEFELYPLGDQVKDEAAGAALVARLRAALGNQLFRDAGGRGELQFDLAGKCLLASLPQPQQQQLAGLLAKPK